MKATLEFSLPDETQEHRDALDGTNWRLACDQVCEQIRQWLKYGHQFKTPDEALEAVRKELIDAADFGI